MTFAINRTLRDLLKNAVRSSVTILIKKLQRVKDGPKAESPVFGPGRWSTQNAIIVL